MEYRIRKLTLLLVLGITLLLTASHGQEEEKPEAYSAATAMTLTLSRSALTGVDDAGGTWQYEGGKVLDSNRQVGWYASTKRVTFKATEAQNTAALTLTVFFLGTTPPENMTLQGAHDFHSGNEIGSVSSASALYSGHIGKQFTRAGDRLTIF
jgi:hypothetical protein